jgi:hypothetical protein
MEVCLVKMEATDLEANPEEKEIIAEQQQVPKEKASVKTVRTLKKQHGDWHLAVGRHRKPKKRTRSNGESWKKLAATCRGMTHCAIPAWCKRHCCQVQGKNKTVPRTQKGWMFRKRRQVRVEGINGKRDQDLKKQLSLRKKRPSGKIFGETTGLEIVK